MSRKAFTPTWQRALLVLTGTFVVVVVIAALYWGRAIFIPLALAIFLTFVLSPLATLLQRWVGHLLSVGIVVSLTVLVLLCVSGVVIKQAMSLLDELPQHTEAIKVKIQSVRDRLERSGGGRLSQMFDELSTHFKVPLPPEQADPEVEDQPGREGPRPVVVQTSHTPWLAWLTAVVTQTVDFLTLTALAVVLFIFMLAKRTDLRNRFIRLTGLDRMTVTTRAVDDAGQRLSRFLVSQAIINGSYGLAMAVGLFVLGVPQAFLWGFLAGVLRYAPYIGAPTAALFPLTLSFAFSESWWPPVLVVVLFVVLEVVFANLIEPWQFGHSMGVSEVALVFSAAFWAILWGPVGLVLSGPLTVCLLVLGKYVPSLQFLEVLLGAEPPLRPSVSYYQRLMARDQDEAAEIVREECKKRPAETIFDEMLIPALSQARQDRLRDDLSAEDELFIIEGTREILDEASECLSQSEEERTHAKGVVNGTTKRVRLLVCPARDEMDQLGLEMFSLLLNPEKWDVHLVDSTALATELLEQVKEFQPAVVCIGSLPPGNLAHTRYLCKRLRKQFPNLHILVGRWGQQERLEAARTALKEVGADHVEGTLRTTRELLRTWISVLAEEQEEMPPTKRGALQRAWS